MTSHLKCKVVVSCSIHHVADLGEAKTFIACVFGDQQISDPSDSTTVELLEK